MKRFGILAILLATPVLAQSVSTDEAYQRLQQRVAERQAAAATQPAADQIAALQAENARLRAIIADLQIQVDTLKGGGAAAATTTPAVASYAPPTYSRANAPTTQPQPSAQAGPNGETPTGQTATGIPTYTGPRGGTYHYSKSGNKVYEKHR